MSNKIRVVLRPDAQAPQAQGFVDGVHVALSGFGGPGSHVGAGAHPATLVLHIAFLDGARGQQPRDFKPFATIRGQLSCQGEPPVPKFVGDKQPIEYDSPASEEEETPRRILRLVFDEATFSEMLDEDGTNAQLVLPDEPRTALFAEIDSVLKVGGQAEADLGDSAILDLPLVPHTALFRLYDGNGEVLAGVPFVALGGGELLCEGNADADGVATITRLNGRDRCVLTWAATEEGPLFYEHEVIVSAIRTTRARLANLGYDAEDGLENVLAIEREFGMDETGKAASVAEFLRGWHDKGQIIVEDGPEEEAAPDSGFTREELDEGAF